MKTHLENACPRRKLKCKYCSLDITQDQMAVLFLQISQTLNQLGDQGILLKYYCKVPLYISIYMCVCIEYSRSKHKVTKIFMHCKLFFLYQQHTKDCPKQPVKCESCGKKKIAREMVCCLVTYSLVMKTSLDHNHFKWKTIHTRFYTDMLLLQLQDHKNTECPNQSIACMAGCEAVGYFFFSL